MSSSPPDSQRRILVRAPNWIGDVCLALPFFRALRRQFPDAHVVAAARPWVAGLLELYEVDEVLPIDNRKTGWVSRLRSLRESVREVSTRRFDTAYSLPHTFSSHIILYLSGIAKRVGHRGRFNPPLLTDATPWRGLNGTHRARSYLELLGPGAAALDPDLLAPLQIPRRWIDRGLEFLGPAGSRPLIGLGVGSEAPSRRWPVEKFATLARCLDQVGYGVVALGTSKDTGMARVIHESSPLLDLTGKTSLPEVMGILKTLAGVVGNDSGLSHLASLVGTPTVTFFGAGNPDETAPLAPTTQVLNLRIACSPCGLKHCPLSLECLTGIEPDLVLDQMLKLMGETVRAGV